jgi:hypothetical protein
MDDQAFNTYLSNIQANASTPQPQAQQPQQGTPQAAPHSSGNWFTHLLPTGGAIGGGLGGAAAGTAILPGIGTVIGGVLGAALGGGGAKAAENAAEGQGIGNGVESSAVEGGVGQALGGVAGKVLGKGAEFLANRAGGAAASEAGAQTAADTLNNTKTLNAIYGGSRNSVENASNIAQQAGIDMTDPAAVHAAGQHLLSNGGQVLDDIVGNNSIPISGAIDQAGNKVAPSIDDLIHSSLTNTNPLTAEKLGASRSTVLGGLGPNQTDEDLLRNGYTRFLSSSAKNGTNTPATGFLNEANQLLSGVNHGSTATAHDLLDAQRLVGDKAQSMSLAAAKPSANEVTQAQAESWKALNHNLQDMIYSHPDISNAAQAMQGTHAAADFGGNQQLADLFNSRVTGAQSGKDINSIMHDAYNLRDVGKDGLDTINNPASTGNLKLAKLDTNGDGVPDALPNAVEAGHKILSGGGGALGMLGRTVEHGVNNPGILSTLSRIGGLGEKLAQPAAITATTAAGMGAAPVDQQPGGIMGGIMNNGQPGVPQAGQPANPINDLYQTLLSNYQASGGITPNDASIAGVLQSLAPMVQKNQLAGTELGGLNQAFDNAGGAQGQGGIMSRIAGLIPGTAANSYQGKQQAAAQSLAQALGISPQAAASLLPQLMQNGQTAGQTQGVLGSLQGQLAN